MTAFRIDFHPHLASPLTGEEHKSEKSSPSMVEGWVGATPREEGRKTA
jgi:hypothetical protein